MTKDSGQEIRDAVVTADDLRRALTAIDDMDATDRANFAARCIAIMGAFGLFDSEDGGEPDEPISDEKLAQVNKVTATQIRIEALACVVDDPKLKAWSMKAASDDAGYILLREDVLKAAAETPLHESTDPSNRRSYFKPDEFFEKLLSVSYEAGHG